MVCHPTSGVQTWAATTGFCRLLGMVGDVTVRTASGVYCSMTVTSIPVTLMAE
jgi:hypothetical protein